MREGPLMASIPVLDAMVHTGGVGVDLGPYSAADVAPYLPLLIDTGALARAPPALVSQLNGHDVALLRALLAVDVEREVVREAQPDAFDDASRAEQSGSLFELASPSGRLLVLFEALRSAGKVRRLASRVFFPKVHPLVQRKLELLDNTYFHADVTLALCVLLRRVSDAQVIAAARSVLFFDIFC